jgi:methylenetetrahydrofolate--tRNA-(uracil-5-)-methyltransferase
MKMFGDGRKHKRRTSVVFIIGGGFAGVEAAWRVAQSGLRAILYEMRPKRMTAVHQSSYLAELVCSNSFKSNLLTNASGVMKEEMRRLDSLILDVASRHSVPAGEALAVDRDSFAMEVTSILTRHPRITIIRDEVTSLPTHRPLIIATGPLTTDDLTGEICRLVDESSLSFYDAVAPTITFDSIDLNKVYRASRRGKTSENDPLRLEKVSDGDYLNCPLTKEEYLRFHAELVQAEQSAPHNPEERDASYFEMCLPIEELARRGERTLAYGPMKPIGLADPRTGKRPWAVVQLRQENKEGTLWGLVGFQTRLKWGEQRRIFRMIPGLEQAEFVRYGVMHRNTYVNAPLALNLFMQVIHHEGVYMAGQLTGVEGYLESAAIGIVAGMNAVRYALGLEPTTPPCETVIGSLCHYLVEANPKHFSPMNSNFGIMPELPSPVRDKKEKARLKGVRALAALDEYRKSLYDFEPGAI